MESFPKFCVRTMQNFSTLQKNIKPKLIRQIMADLFVTVFNDSTNDNSRFNEEIESESTSVLDEDEAEFLEGRGKPPLISEKHTFSSPISSAAPQLQSRLLTLLCLKNFITNIFEISRAISSHNSDALF